MLWVIFILLVIVLLALWNVSQKLDSLLQGMWRAGTWKPSD